jgi:hypothetical protein
MATFFFKCALDVHLLEFLNLADALKLLVLFDWFKILFVCLMSWKIFGGLLRVAFITRCFSRAGFLYFLTNTIKATKLS